MKPIMNESTRMKARQQAVYWAVVSRCVIFALQLIANLAPDHNADAFIPDVGNTTNFVDALLRNAFDGFNKWDSKYFLYIAEHGYTSENQFAFFPLFPLCVSAVASTHVKFLPSISFHTSCLCSAVIINFFLFPGAASALYDLTENTFGCVRLAALSTLAFSFNPASIFFSACYTESMFAFCVFRGLCCISSPSRKTIKNVSFRQYAASTVWFIFAALTRSNGTINAGFVAHAYITYIVLACMKSRPRWYVVLFSMLQCVFLCGFIMLPFLSFNLYGYVKFCEDENWFAYDYNQSCPNLPTWCRGKLPFVYNHIQRDNWGLGLFAYYKLKKLPNFILAFPIVAIATHAAVLYCSKNPIQTMCLGLPFRQVEEERSQNKQDLAFLTKNLFSFVAHLCFLVVFSLLFMHVEVTTRMLLSSSPFIYWVTGSYLRRDLLDKSTSHMKTWKRLSASSQLIIVYFLTYFTAGTILHVNFLPWT